MVLFAVAYGCKKESVHLPFLITNDVTDISNTSATCGGDISDNGGLIILRKGICWSINESPTYDDSITTDGNGSGAFTGRLTGLEVNRRYYARAYAANNAGTGYGNQVSFTTAGLPPVAATKDPVNLTSSSVVLSGTVNPYNSPTRVFFQYGTSLNYGSTSTPLTSTFTEGSDISVTSQVASLIPGTKYHFRMAANNAFGTTYGSDVIFTTYMPDGTKSTVTDIEGNIYVTVVIGSQIWMAENLKSTMLNDGTALPEITNGLQWSQLIKPAYCWYANDAVAYKQKSGALYNWFAVNTGKLAPAGWHVPNQEEWTTLITYLGGEYAAGGPMKSLTYWYSPNTGATNASGFSALPAGGRYSLGGGYSDFGDKAFFWTATPSPSEEYALYHYLENNSVRVDNSFNIMNYRVDGFSVRCVKD